MTLLEKFYNKQIFEKGMPKFKDLTDMQKIRMKDTYSFDLYRAKHELKEAKEKFPVVFFITWGLIAIISSIILFSVVIGFKTIFFS